MIKFINRMLLLSMAIFLTTTSAFAAQETILGQTALTSGKVTLTFAAAPLKAMTEIPFSLEITDDTGNEINDAELSINMDMPAMPMPPNTPEATWREGAYRGAAIFTMAGKWQMTVDIQRPGHDLEQVKFAIEQVLMK